MPIKTTLLIPDIQYPLHDALMLRKIISVADYLQPHRIAQVGDGVDFTEAGQWVKNTSGEYAPTLQANIDGYVSDVLEPLSEAAPRALKEWEMGNHDERVETYVKKWAPALASLRALSMESLFRTEELGWEIKRGLNRVSTNTFMLHGHEGSGYSATASAWDNKFKGKYGSDKNYVFGHTHQPFIIHRAFGYDGDLRPRFTMNVGSIMDPSKASYLKDGSASWVMSFGVLRDDGKRVYPELITAVDRGFYFEGKKF